MDYFVYIVRCSDNSLYTGIATNLEKRIKEHNGQLKGGARYTRGKGPVILKHFEKYNTRSQALKREAEIKKMQKSEKEKLLPTSSTTATTTATGKSPRGTTRRRSSSR